MVVTSSPLKTKKILFPSLFGEGVRQMADGRGQDLGAFYPQCFVSSSGILTSSAI